MCEDRDRHPDGEREDLMDAAIRVLYAERELYEDAYAPDSYEARRILACAAQTYVRAIDRLPEGCRPRDWQMDEVEELRARAASLAEENAWLHALAERNNKVIGIWADYHINVHPLPEDVRKKIVAAMDGVSVEEVRD